MKKYILGLAFLFLNLSISAQRLNRTILLSSGEALTSANFSLNFSLGEPIVGPITSGALALSQGFWAGFDIFDPLQPNTIDETGIVVYPIPTNEELNIVTGQRELFGLRLFAIDRRMVLSTTTDVDVSEHQVDTGTLAPGVYVLQLFLNDTTDTVQFKIVKE